MNSCLVHNAAVTRFGTPHGARAALWEAALCLAPLSQHDVSAFSVLCNSVLAQRSLLDVCVCDDLRFITDSEHFFLFEEVLRCALGTPKVPVQCLTVATNRRRVTMDRHLQLLNPTSPKE